MVLADYECLGCGTRHEIPIEIGRSVYAVSRAEVASGQKDRPCWCGGMPDQDGWFLKRKYTPVAIGQVPGAGGSPSR